eukprot:3885523-Lingulodinium_polyedra.AAC.1
MDRRIQVFELLMQDRFELYGLRLLARKDLILQLFTKLKEAGRTAKMDWEWPWQHIGVFQLIYEESKEKREEDIKLLKLRHVLGAEA